jgi:hypothetical protein
MPEHLPSGTVEQHVAGVLLRVDLAGETDRVDGPRRMHEDRPLSREAVQLPLERLRHSAPRRRVGEVGLDVLETWRAPATDVDDARIVPGRVLGERPADAARCPGYPDQGLAHATSLGPGPSRYQVLIFS